MTPPARDASVALSVGAAILVGSLLPFAGGVPGSPRLGVGADKWIHAAEFAVLTVAVARAVAHGRTRGRALRLTVAAALGFGLGIELLQVPLPWRSGSAADLAADAVGVAATLAVRLARDVGRSTD